MNDDEAWLCVLESWIDDELRLDADDQAEFSAYAEPDETIPADRIAIDELVFRQ